VEELSDGGVSGAGPQVDLTDVISTTERGPHPADPATDADAASQVTVDILAAVRELDRQTRAFHARAQNYEQTIRQMQSRIEQLQGDQVQALLKPLIQQLAGLHAQAAEATEQALARGEAAEKDLRFFALAIEDALGLLDIESVAAAPSAEFDPSRHHALRAAPTDDPSLDRRIQRVLRQGFTYAGAPRVFLPARVTIYRYEPGEGAPGD
jgi:molecular chaperone GrpE (heat shock protein)